MQGFCTNSMPPLLCESLRGCEGRNSAPALICLWRYYQRRSTDQPNQYGWMRWRCEAEVCRSDSLITAQVLHSTKYREMNDKAMLEDQTKHNCNLLWQLIWVKKYWRCKWRGVCPPACPTDSLSHFCPKNSVCHQKKMLLCRKKWLGLSATPTEALVNFPPENSLPPCEWLRQCPVYWWWLCNYEMKNI